MTSSLCIWFQQCKLGIVKFIEAKQVPEVETVIHLVVASSDTRHSVATAADLELKSKQRYVKGLIFVFISASPVVKSFTQ